MLRFHITFLIVIFLPLAGCKIQLDQTEGGGVVSSSGLFNCTSRETCTLHIEDEYFQDSFTAMPDDGYVFVGYSEEKGELCRGRLDPICSDIDTRALQAFPDLIEYISGDVAFKLAPQFERLAGAAQDELSSANPIETEYRLINYEVDGNTIEKIRDAKAGSANPLDYRDYFGRKPDGMTRWRVNYSWSWRNDGVSCYVTALSFKIELTTTLPVLKDLSQKSEHIVDKWIAYRQGLLEHEVGHTLLAREHLLEIPDTLLGQTGVSEADCAMLTDNVNFAFSERMESLSEASADYDEETNYGRYTIPPL
jgi:predicted secreted Zn-dependent protease